LGPAAIGSHIDHIIVREIVEQLEASQILLWADLPYAARVAFDRHGFDAKACGGHLSAKIHASNCYATQIGFQFGSLTALDEVLEIDGAEWFSATAPFVRA